MMATHAVGSRPPAANPLVDARRERRCITIQGIVQGVGFRPFVYGLAQRYGLAGYVLNDATGVTIEVEGELATLEQFLCAIRDNPPSLAQIAS